MANFTQRLLAKIYKRAQLTAATIINLICSAFGHVRRLRNYVRRTWPGTDPVADSISAAVYVHYDRRGVVHDYVIHQLRDLVAAGFRITFVTNSPTFGAQSVAEVAPFCRQVIWRRNVGYDFGAYKDGIAAIGDVTRLSRLLLMNDSVYGPFRPIASVLSDVGPDKTDMWGITDSWEFNYHVQTYFVVFFERALRTPDFLRFWRNLPYVNRKDWVIKHGEIKLTQTLTKRKLRASVLAPYWDVARTVVDKLEGRSSELPSYHDDFLKVLHNYLIRGTAINPSHFFWDTLVLEYRCPFLKREVISANPAELPYSWRWPEVVGRVPGYDIGLIRRHLQAI